MPVLPRTIVLLIATALAPPAHAASNIVRDGSLGAGPATALVAAGTVTKYATTYNKIAIPENYGRRAGGNVFHSFSNFSVGSGDGAVFTIDSAAANVISRVTGGQISTIGGLLSLDAQDTGSKPNFFFINPAGVTFAPGAAVDVPAAFHVGTADYLKFADGDFHADTARASTFSSAAPEAFGFLGTTSATIDVGSGVDIWAEPLQPIGVIGGTVVIDGALYSQGGDIRVAALGKTAQEVGLSGALPDAYGNLYMRDGGRVDASNFWDGGKGGDVAVSAKNIYLYDSTIASDFYYGTSGHAGNVDVKASGDLYMTGGRVRSETYSWGNAGTVRVHAGGKIVIDDRYAGNDTGVSSTTWSWYGAGNAGNVEVAADGDVQVFNGGAIHSTTASAGAAGTVEVSGRRVWLDGYGSKIKSEATSDSASGQTGDVSVAATESVTVSRSGMIGILNGGGAGDPAAVTQATLSVAAPDIFADGGQIGSSTSGAAAAARVAVAGTNGVSVTDGGLIVSSTYAAGDTGPVTVGAGDLLVAGGGRIETGTTAAGSGGQVRIDAVNVTIDGKGDASVDTSIGSVTTQSASGRSGDVRVEASGSLSIVDGGKLTTDAYSDGRAGSIAVNAASIEIDARLSGLFTAITSAGNGNGDGGDIDIDTTGNILVAAGGKIYASTPGAANAGDVSVKAGGDVAIDGKGVRAGILDQTNGTGMAGNIVVTAKGTLSILDGGQVDSSAFAAGRSGPIRIDAGNVVIDGRGGAVLTGIIGDTYGTGAAGGIDVSTGGQLFLAAGGRIAARTYGAGNAGDVTVTAGSVDIGSDAEITNSANAGSGNAGAIALAVAGGLSLAGSGQISSSTWSAGNAGPVTVKAASIAIDGQGKVGGIFSNASEESSAKAGSVDVTADTALSLLDGGQISSSTWSSGPAGWVKVNAESIEIDGQLTGIYSNASTGSSADAGAIEVTTRAALSLLRGGTISSSTWSSGGAGSVTVNAGTVTIDGDGSPDTTGIFSTASTPSTGNAGNVTIAASGSLAVVDGGQINSSTYSSGDAGAVKVTAAGIVVDDRGSADYTGISSSTLEGAGNAGSVELTTSGDLSILNGGMVESKTQTSGRAGLVKVRAGSIAIAKEGSGISSDAMEGSQGNAGGIDVAATRSVSMIDGGYISSSTSGSGNAGSVDVEAASIAIDGNGVYTGIYSGTNQDGRGGDVSVTVLGDIDLKAGGVIAASAGGAGDAGNIAIKAGSIAVDGANSVDYNTGIESSSYAAASGPSGNAGNVAIAADTVSLTRNGRISSNTAANGRGGTLTLDVRNLRLTEGGNIGSETGGTGNAGDIAIVAAEDVVIDGVGDVHGWLDNGTEVNGQFSSIFLDTSGSGNGGTLQLTTKRLVVSDGGGISAIATDGMTPNLPETKAGDIRIDAGTIALTGGGGISASTSGAGTAGSVTVNATDSIAIGGHFDHRRHPSVTNTRVSDRSGITGNATYVLNKNAKALGAGGNVSVSAPLVTLTDGGEVTTNTEGAGRAGSIRIATGTLTVDGAASRIDASATVGSGGQTGGVAIEATKAVLLSNGGTLSVRNDATVADPGGLTPTLLTVTAPVVTLKDASITAESKGNISASDIRVDFTERLFLDPSSITTSAVGGNGGAIGIAGGNGVVVLDNSQITTSTRLGNGGPIAITAGALIMNSGFVLANAENGPAGGTVNIDVRTLVPSGNTLFLGGQTLQDFTPGVFGYNVIQAAAPTGLSGTVQITAPALDISGVLTGLSAQLLDTGGLGRSPCQIGGGSSLVQSGRGGFAPSARDLLGPAPVTATKTGALPLPNDPRPSLALHTCSRP